LGDCCCCCCIIIKVFVVGIDIVRVDERGVDNLSPCLVVMIDFLGGTVVVVVVGRRFVVDDDKVECDGSLGISLSFRFDLFDESNDLCCFRRRRCCCIFVVVVVVVSSIVGSANT